MTSQQQSKVTNEILNGNLIQLMLKLTIPGIVGMLLIGLNTFLDALFAGQFISETALAAISLALPLTSILVGCAYCVGVGCASVLSRAIGSGDVKTQSKIFGTLVIMSVVISLFITILGYRFAEELISFMGGSGEVASYGASYFKIYSLGSVFYILAVASSQLIKSEGKIRLAMIFAGIFVIINAILNPIFIIVFHWGIQGIALATVIAMFIYSIVNVTYFLSGKSSIPANPRKLTLAIDLLPAILSVGISALLMEVISFIEQVVIFKSIAHYGTDNDIAFAGATLRVYALAILPINGFVQALQPVIGMNYGAQNYQRLKKAYFTFGIAATILLTLIWLPLQLSPTIFLSLLLPSFPFTPNDLLNFKIINSLIPILPFAICSVALFQALGNGKTAGIILILRSLLLLIPFVLIFAAYLGVRGIYLGMVFADILVFLISCVITLLEFKKISIKTQLI
jgi:putative MATE family efflux protein